MLRRNLITGTIGLPFLPRLAAAQPVPAAGWRRFEIRTEVALDAGGEAATLWLPLAQNAGAYQRAEAPQVTTNGTAETVADGRYGAAMVRIAFPAGLAPTASLVQQVSTAPRGAEPADLSGREQAFWTAPTASVPTDGIVGETAGRIVGGLQDPADKARALYDWVVDNTFRNGATRGCGTGDIKAMLETGWLGGKCADINSLMTGLARACGIPARDVYGIRVAPSAFSPSLGAAGGDITRAQHCRTELWIDAARGWVPVDPADVRKVVLEENVPVDSDHVRRQRERLFGHWEMNWVGFNSATDLVLPGAPRPLASNFLMYPCAMTASSEKDCLDAASFRYTIGVRQVPA